MELIKEGAEISSLINPADDPLLLYALKNSAPYEFVKFLIESKINLDDTTFITGSALCKAVSMRQNEIAKLLIAGKADLNIAEGYTGNTALHLAIESENNEMAKLLIDNNANLNIRNKSMFTPLEMAIVKKNDEIIKYLIDNPATDLTIQNNILGGPSLCQAISRRNAETAKFLISRVTDATLNTPYTSGKTPFHLAIETEQHEIAMLLIERKVNLDTKDESGETPLMSAIDSNYKELALLLIENGVDLDAQNNKPFTAKRALFQALYKKDVEIAMRLIESGANVQIHDRHGSTALDLAYTLGNNPLIMLLIKKGCKHGLFNPLGYLAYAISEENNELAKLLIENKLDITPPDPRRKPLIEAISRKNDEIARLLIESAPESINTRHLGNTPLIEAIQSENPELARFLIEKGANPTIINPFIRMQPLALAVQQGYSELVELLIEKKALFTDQQSEPLVELNELLIRLAKYKDPEMRDLIVNAMRGCSFRLTVPALKMIKKAIKNEMKPLLSMKEKKLSTQLGRLKKAISRCEKSIKEENVESLKELKMRKEEEIQNAREVAATPIDIKELKAAGSYPFISGWNDEKRLF
jgi:ankyrin repeat protein